MYYETTVLTYCHISLGLTSPDYANKKWCNWQWCIWHSEDYTSWYILIIKPTRCTNFSNLFLE